MGTLQRHTLAALVLGAGCAPPPPGPRDLTESMRFFWRTTLDTPDEDLVRLLRAVVGQVDGEALVDDIQVGTQLPFQKADLEVVDFFTPDGRPTKAPDASKALPAYILSRFSCTIDGFLDVLVTDDQNAAFGSVRNGDQPYEAYSRTYYTSKKDFRSGKVPSMSWEGSLTTYIPIAGTYVYNFRSDARRVPIPADVVEELGLADDEFLLTRTWLPYPATWEGSSFDQDYQLEVVIPWTATEVVKIYPVWRDWQMAFGSFAEPIVVNTTLDQMRRWDESTEQLCLGGG